MRTWFYRVCVLLTLAVLPSQAAAETRVALVIGNSDYLKVPSLRNPVNDAEDIGRALRQLGFETIVATNIARDKMRDAVNTFADRARSADVALFYFAGHGFQVDGQNYLAPTDFDITRDIGDEAVSLGDVIRGLGQGDAIKLVILDACRNQPADLVAGSDIELGFAEIKSAADFLIAFATQPGAVSWDGNGRNGVFTSAILSHILTPGRSITDLLIRVRRDVMARTGGQQVPWDNSSLTRQFVFADGRQTVSSETSLYQLAARSGSDRLLQFYLDLYPDGVHAASARDILNGTLPDSQIVAQADLKPDDLYPLLRQSPSRSLAVYYLEEFPDGPHVDDVRQLIEAMPDFAQLGADVRCEKLATHPRDATHDFPGVPSQALAQHADEAIAVCFEAADAFPEQPRFKALLARSYAAKGDGENAVRYFREAMAQGDLRAMMSLGHLMYAGRWVAQDREGALNLYRLAAEAGSEEGANNVAIDMLSKNPDPETRAQAMALLQSAYDNGSAEAALNLAYLALKGDYETRDKAFDLYVEAAKRGSVRGLREAAAVLQHGVGREADPVEAANLLLRAAVEDDGAVLGEFIGGGSYWLPATIRAMQERLARAGVLDAPADGVAGPATVRALTLWRNGGYDPDVLVN